ncbi:MAG: CFI-box-CTERM domain-containing protein [Candidatus Bathyarchaeia archaeon]
MGTITASFTVASGSASGSYTVIVTGSPGGDTATATFTDTGAGPATAFFLNPASGLAGTTVAVSGANYAGTTCSLSSAPSGLFSSTPTCSISGGTLTGHFTVAVGAAVGGYTVTVTTNVSSDTNTAPFTIPAPTFAASPASGAVGTAVTASGSNYEGTTCSLSSAPSGLFTSSTCTISSGALSGGFTVASAAALGGYTVTVTTNVAGEVKTAPFTVTPVGAPTFDLSPTSGAVGTSVTVSGTNYAGTTCSLSSAPSGLFTSSSCSISAGALSGGFTVTSGASPRSYTVTVTTNAGETPSATFTALGALTFNLTPTSGIVGTMVTASGSNYAGVSCTLSADPSGLFTSQSCSISGGALAGSFTVGSGASPGTLYTVTVNTDASESKSASFTVPTSSGHTTLTLSPTSGAAGTAISASGTGYFGTTCTLSASGLFGSAACAISGGRLTGGFTVAVGAAVGGYTVTVTTDVSSDTTSAVFSVTKATTPMCIIATATFGSEAAPAVQLLRNFRDGLVLHTRAGSAFMNVFNAWYYSFSPTVANFISTHDPIRAPIKVILYPLLGILSVSTMAYSIFSWTPEFGVLIAGLIASSLIGLVYLTPFTLVGMRSLTRRKRINTISITKASLLVLVTALGLLAAGELAGSFLILAIASSAIVLTCIIAAPTIVALLVLRPKSQ